LARTATRASTPHARCRATLFGTQGRPGKGKDVRIADIECGAAATRHAVALEGGSDAMNTTRPRSLQDIGCSEL
jgi:hypothetical protein